MPMSATSIRPAGAFSPLAHTDASVAEREQQLKDSDRIWRLIRKASGDDVPEPEPVPVPEPEPSFDYYDYGYFG